MFKLRRIKFKKTKEFLKRLPRILSKNSFLTSLVLIFLALILGSLLLYKYSILVERLKPEILEKPLSFDEKAFQEILKIWQEREKRFEEIEFKEYPDLFQGLTE